MGGNVDEASFWCSIMDYEIEKANGMVDLTSSRRKKGYS
jgi:hypothetical protein